MSSYTVYTLDHVYGTPCICKTVYTLEEYTLAGVYARQCKRETVNTKYCVYARPCIRDTHV